MRSNKTLIRILTENMHSPDTLKIVEAQFEAFTVYKAGGSWKGKHEDSLVIEILAENDLDIGRARRVAAAIKSHFEQEAVLIEYIAVQSELI